MIKRNKKLLTRRVRMASPLRIDPTRTGKLRQQFVTKIKFRFDRLKIAIIKFVEQGDAFKLTTNAEEFAFKSDPEKVKAFQEWLREQLNSYIIGKTEEDLWKKFAEEGFRRGAERAFSDVNVAKRAEAEGDKSGTEKLSFYAGTREEFLRSSFGRPVATDKIKLLADRSFDDLKNVTTDMATKISRTLVDGLTTGKGPRDIAREMTKQTDMGLTRATTIARTEIIRAHAEGQLMAMEDLGVEEVGVAVEWSTAGDEQVCDLCAPLEGVVLSVQEAKGMLPRHPNCRCAWLPAGVGEDDKNQKKTKAAVTKAIGQSKEAAGKPVEGAEGWGNKDIGKTRPADKAVITSPIVKNSLYSFSRYLNNVFCATGKGGGIDATCSPGQTGGGSDDGAIDPPSPHDVKVLKTLPGSTNPKLVEAPDGSKWVMKEAGGKITADHLRNEATADAIYKALGIRATQSAIVETKDGPVKMAKYIEGGQTLAQWKSDKSTAEVAAMHEKIGEHMAADALLANWDVVGMSHDNIIIKDGDPYRIDAGGALKYRAQGGKKGSLFNEQVNELKSLKDPYTNSASAKVFKDVTDADLRKQMYTLVGKRNEILNAVKDDPETKAMLGKRLDTMEAKLKQPATVAAKDVPKAEPEKVTSAPQKESTFIPKEATAHGKVVTNIISKNAADKFTELQVSKIGILNPEGIKNGVLKVPKAINDKQHAELLKLFPPGTKVQKVNAVASKLGLKPFEATKASDVFTTSRPSYSSGGVEAKYHTGEVTKLDYEAVAKEVISKLKPAERAALVSYTGGGYSALNTAMRSCPPDFKCLQGTTKSKMENIQSALAKVPILAKPVEVSRGIDVWNKNVKAELIENLTNAHKTGEVFQMPSFSSTSTSKGFSGNIRFKIQARTGLFVKPISQHPHENEILMSPHAKFKVTKVDTSDTYGNHTVHLEEIV